MTAADPPPHTGGDPDMCPACRAMPARLVPPHHHEGDPMTDSPVPTRAEILAQADHLRRHQQQLGKQFADYFRRHGHATEPAGELRAAAARLRALATAVSAPAPEDQPFHADGCDITQGRRGMYDVGTVETPELAAYIAAMHPGVGTALADWLDEAAHAYESAVTAAVQTFRDDDAAREQFLTTGPGAPSVHALTIARAVNQQ